MTQQAVITINNSSTIEVINTTFDKEISIERIACPLHVLELKQGLKAIESGSVLKVNSNEHVIPELLAAARQIASSAYSDENHILFVTK
jgi:TusA-related sulfurtransferase